MTREEARAGAKRLAAAIQHPVLVLRSPAGPWIVSHAMDAAGWLGGDGEVVVPDRLRAPERVEGELRALAARLRGPARATVLEAVMTVRGRLAVTRRQGWLPAGAARRQAGWHSAGP